MQVYKRSGKLAAYVLGAIMVVFLAITGSVAATKHISSDQVSTDTAHFFEA